MIQRNGRAGSHSTSINIKSGFRITRDLTVIDHIGGTGKVDIYRCRSRSLKRVVACKILLPEKEHDKVVRDALLREGDILQRLRHPNVVEGYSVQAEPYPLVVLEYLEGQSLKNTFFEGNYGAFDIDDFINIVLQLSDALTYVHDQGLLHLDVKPTNVIYNDGQVKLIDFSLAREFTPEHPLRHKSGTVEYMAPEQAFRQDLSYATDVFGLGVVFYRLLTGGRFPYAVIEYLDDKEESLRQLDYKPTPISPSKLNPSVPVAIDPIALRAINPDINERFQTPAEFKATLLAVGCGRHYNHGEDT